MKIELRYILVISFILIVMCVSYYMYAVKTEGLISTINDDFQRPRAYFHPFTTDYESYARSQLRPSDPRSVRDEKMLVSRLLS